MSEPCACGKRTVLSRTGFGTGPGDPAVHAWSGCVIFRDRRTNLARNDVEDALSAAGHASQEAS